MTALPLSVCTSAAVFLLLSVVSCTAGAGAQFGREKQAVDVSDRPGAPDSAEATLVAGSRWRASESEMLEAARSAAQPSVEDRDIVFIRGLDSSGDCDQAEQWLEEYLESDMGRSFFGSVRVGRYLHFDYGGGGSYDCPRSEPAYGPGDTCDGVAKASGELKDLIDTETGAEVTVVAHSMGGLAAAYLIATNSAWATSHIASVVSFDSPLKGVSEPLRWGQLLLTTCTAIGGNPLDSLVEMAEDSAVVRHVAAAATVVPFYTLDATQPDIAPLGIEFVPRDRASLEGGRPFQWANHCGQPGADQGACDPPAPVDDDHSSVWSCRFDQSVGGGCPASGVDKGFLVGCATAATLDCTLQDVAVSQEATVEASLAVVPRATRARFASHSGGIVRMTLTSPDGTVYGPDGAGPVAGYEAEAGAEVYEIDNPTAGEWTVELLGVDVEPEGEVVALALLTTGDVSGLDSGTAERPDIDGDGGAAPVARIVAIVVAAAGIIGGAAWYARRRWLS